MCTPSYQSGLELLKTPHSFRRAGVLCYFADGAADRVKRDASRGQDGYPSLPSRLRGRAGSRVLSSVVQNAGHQVAGRLPVLVRLAQPAGVGAAQHPPGLTPPRRRSLIVAPGRGGTNAKENFSRSHRRTGTPFFGWPAVTGA